MTRRFRLYPEEAAWWSMNDYGAVLDVMARLKPRTVLEFGPGSSTLALVEGGAERVDSCEDNPDWATVYVDRLEKRFPGVVRIVPYTWSDPIVIPWLGARRYDMALIDGPHGIERRGAVLSFALARCDAVLMCCEDAHSAGLRSTIIDIATAAGRAVEIMETGPLAGSFALVT